MYVIHHAHHIRHVRHIRHIYHHSTHTPYTHITSRRYGTWITDHGGIHSPTEQYVVAFYFATMTLTTVGYGDISPVNFVEYTVVLSLVGHLCMPVPMPIPTCAHEFYHSLLTTLYAPLTKHHSPHLHTCIPACM